MSSYKISVRSVTIFDGRWDLKSSGSEGQIQIQGMLSLYR